MATKLCPFKKNCATRMVSDEETVEYVHFGTCDGEGCMAYSQFEIIKCALMRRES